MELINQTNLNKQVKNLIVEEDMQSVSEASFFKSLWQQTAPLFRAPLLKNTVKLFYLVTIIYMT